MRMKKVHLGVPLVLGGLILLALGLLARRFSAQANVLGNENLATSSLEAPPSGLVSSTLDDRGLDQTRWVVRAFFDDPRQVADLSSWTEPWEVNYDKGFVVLEVSLAQYNLLVITGFKVEIDWELTARARRENVPLEGQTRGIPEFACYRTVEETYATAQQIVSDYPQLATWIDIGDSWEKTEPSLTGYDLQVLKLTNQATPGPKGVLFIMTSVHAREYTPAELNTRFAEYLVSNYGVDPDVTWLLDYNEVHMLLQANPDGRKKAENGSLWRKNTNQNYCSPTSSNRGADLNRNFPFHWGCCTGSSTNECDTTYRGPSPASEPETQAIRDYVRAIFPDQRADDVNDPAPADAMGIFLDIHSYSQLVLWPWGFTHDPAPNGTALQTLGRKFAYFNGYAPEQAIGLYPTDGTTDDFAYGDLGLAAYTFELGTSFFQDCGTFENVILPKNMPALIYALKAARTPYRTPAGPDALNLSLSKGLTTAGEIVTLTAEINDARFQNSKGNEPTQNIAAAAFYLDTPPWITSTTSVSYTMTPVDGNFDNPVEQVSGLVDTHALTSGRHLVYVQGKDAAGNWGALSAVFLYVMSGTDGAAVGRLTDGRTGQPLFGTVNADALNLSAPSDAQGPGFALKLPAGKWNLRASAPYHLDRVISGVAITDSFDTQVNFVLTPTAGMKVDKQALTSFQKMDTVTQGTLRILNPGNQPLNWSLKQREGGSVFSRAGQMSVLLVDDDDNSPNVRPWYEAALGGLGIAYDVFDVGGGAGDGPSVTAMQNYDVVIWFSGDQFGTPGTDKYAGPNDHDETQLAAYLDGGGKLLLSSQDYYYDQNGVTSFMANYLGIAGMSNDIGDYTTVAGQNDFSDYGPYSLNPPGTDYSDPVNPTGAAKVAWLGNNGKNAGVYTQNTVFLPFQWEGIQRSSAANGMEALQAMLDQLIPPDIPWLDVFPTAGVVPPLDYLELTLTFSATAPVITQPGVYTGTLNFSGDDPSNPHEVVAVEMTVGDYPETDIQASKVASVFTTSPTGTFTYTLGYHLAAGGMHTYSVTLDDPLPSEINVLTGSLLLDGTPASGLYDASRHAISSTLTGNLTDTMNITITFAVNLDIDEIALSSGLLSGTMIANSFFTITSIDGSLAIPPEPAWNLVRVTAISMNRKIFFPLIMR